MRILTILLLLFFPFSSYADSLEAAKRLKLEEVDAISWKKLECTKDKAFICSEESCTVDNNNTPQNEFTYIFDRPHEKILVCFAGSNNNCTIHSAFFSTTNSITHVMSHDWESFIITGNKKFTSYAGLPSKWILENKKSPDKQPRWITTIIMFGSCHEID